MTFGSSFREVRKNEGVRNRDSTVVNICLVVEKKNVFFISYDSKWNSKKH